jgi:sulfide:quinone oxidoreductase
MAGPIVCVAGAGTAGLEALLCAREALGADAELRLIAPDREFRYRPMSPDSLFHPAGEHGLAIGDLAAEVGATWVGDAAAAVDESARYVLTREGETISFDFLLLALGGRSHRVMRQGYTWERGADPGFLDEVIADLRAGKARSVAIVVPRGARWPLPAYELALVLAWTATGSSAQITLITAEEQPLAALGRAASDAIAAELHDAGVETINGVEPIDDPDAREDPSKPVQVVFVPESAASLPGSLVGKPTDPQGLRLGDRKRAEFDRLISLPSVDGPFLSGVATDAVGFIEVDEGLRVCGSERVWAAGGCVSAALEHSALGALQADVAIGAIARVAAAGDGARAATAPGLDAPDLTGMLLTGQRERWLAENPAGTQQPSTRCLWWPPGRAVGRMLARHIAAWDPSVEHELPDQARGLVIRVPVALGCSRQPPTRGGASTTDRAARLRDIDARQLMALRRRERATEAELREMDAKLQTLAARQQAVVKELRHHGYLSHRRVAS